MKAALSVYGITLLRFGNDGLMAWGLWVLMLSSRRAVIVCTFVFVCVHCLTVTLSQYTLLFRFFYESRVMDKFVTRTRPLSGERSDRLVN